MVGWLLKWLADKQYKKQFNIIILAHAEIWCEAESEVQVLE